MFTFVFRALAAYVAFLVPSFQTYKALSHRPISEPELERWSQYWAVIGVLVAFEYLAEFLISWLPFYFELKTLFILFLALPQTQGSTYIYVTYLQPFFVKNEADLDADILSIHQKTLAFAQTQLAALWQFVVGVLTKNTSAGQQASATPGPAPTPGASLSLESAMGLFRTYGPSFINALQPAAAAAAPATAPTTPSPAPSAASSSFAFGTATPEHRTPGVEEAPPPFPEPQHF